MKSTFMITNYFEYSLMISFMRYMNFAVTLHKLASVVVTHKVYAWFEKLSSWYAPP